MATQFGKYLLQRKLAEGGMAEVFLARQSGMHGFEKPVVVKRILPHLCHDDGFVEMFLNEARVAARLNHPAIVQIFDFDVVDDQYYIAMEYIHGEDVRAIARQAEKTRRRPSLGVIARVLADVLGGLHYAHTRTGADGRPLGLVHRDVSPQNILVSYEGSVKLVDFGIAKATESSSTQQTQAGLLKGKYAYMSPEQCRGRKVDARSDVFSVGILLWELVTWRRLFRKQNDLATLVAVADEPIPALSSLRPDVPPELERICARALERDLARRYPSAQAMQSDLEALIRQKAWEADSIRLQRYMRETFEEKLAAQAATLRAAGVGSLEDFLATVDEGTDIAWMASAAAPLRDSASFDRPAGTDPGHRVQLPPPSAERTMAAPPSVAPAPVPLAAPTAGSRSGPIPVGGGGSRSGATPTSTSRSAAPAAARPTVLSMPTQGREPSGAFSPSVGDVTPSTMRQAVGQMEPARRFEADATREGDARESTRQRRPSPPSRRRGVGRVVLVATMGAALAGAVAAAALWPPAGRPVSAGGGSGGAIAQSSTVRVLLDLPARVTVDGVAQPSGREVEVQVTAHEPHHVRVQHGADPERAVEIPALDPGAVHTVRLRLK